MKYLPEILAPAGDLACLKAAVAAGADAVYFGGQAFNARRSAGGFTAEDVKEAVRLCRMRGVKTNLTLNTLIKQREWPSFLAYIDEILPLGIDNVIVQDPGVAMLVHERYPQISLHASTQMAVQDLDGVLYLKKLGFSRVVLAREVTLEEIRKIHEATDVELEVFVHGALCYSYSGRCLMSSFHGGRSGNRGACAQPCRMAYQAGGKEGYFMNLKDLCGAYHLQELIEAGVASLKIEGRLKGEAYVAGITGYYKGLMEEYAEKGRLHRIQEEELDTVKQLFNRGGFTDGYYVDKQQMIEGNSPKHQGIPVAKVTQVSKGKVTIQSSKPLHSGDELEFRIGQPPYPTLRLAASMLLGETKAVFYLKDAVQPGTQVWRVVDPVLQQSIMEKAAILPQVPVGMSFEAIIGKPAKLSAYVIEAHSEEEPWAQTIEGPVVEAATARGLSEEAVAKQLTKTGDTGFSVQHLEMQLQEGSFLPVSVLNQMRRGVLEQLSVVEEYQPENAGDSLENSMERAKGRESDIWFGLDNPEQWDVLSKMNVDKITVLLPNMEGFEKADKAEFLRLAAGKTIVPTLPMVGRLSHLAWMEKEVRAWMELGVMDFEANLIGQVAMIERLGGRVWTGPGLAVMNRAAASFWQQRAQSLMLSWELTGREMEEIGRPKGAYWMAYGRIPYMVSEQCIYKEARGCGKRDEGRQIQLKDRKGELMMVRSHCKLCYSEILSEKPLYLLGKKAPAPHARIQLTVENSEQVQELWRAYLEERMPAFGVQVGHWDKGVD
ncbi:MAG: U32 family peptidase [Firmicutes bacterium]|nr:U32 family peptidase [Bacillota bacterium]